MLMDGGTDGRQTPDAGVIVILIAHLGAFGSGELISGLLRLVSKLSDITCTCMALDSAITARVGHFTGSVRKNLAAVLIRL